MSAFLEIILGVSLALEDWRLLDRGERYIIVGPAAEFEFSQLRRIEVAYKQTERSTALLDDPRVAGPSEERRHCETCDEKHEITKF